MKSKVTSGVMLNAYPDSMGQNLNDILSVLDKDQLKGVFDSFYILPSVFNTDLDRGFSIIDYGLNTVYASKDDIDRLKKAGISLKFDFVLNHLSVLSKQFQDLIKNGSKSAYKDFFINWNEFWKGTGQIEEGVLRPDENYIKDMFFRKPSLPILMVNHPNGEKLPYWNTFYQEEKFSPVNEQELMFALDLQYLQACVLRDRINGVLKEGGKLDQIDFSGYEAIQEKIVDLLETKKQYLGQMDLNIQSPLVWDFYEDTLEKLSDYGASIVRLDAFAYSSKKVGKRNFFNLPETWDDLDKVKQLADKHQIELLPEIHSKYEEKLHEEICEKGFLTYDFFLPGLIIDALERSTNEVLIKWINDIQSKGLKVVNMLGCHDGIPLLDLKGLLSDDQIEDLIKIVVDRGGYVKELHGKKNMYYQVNATYFSALGEDEKKMKLARAIQIFMPGKPQVWYLDLFAGTNDYEAVKRGGAGSHKEINRTNLSLEDIESRLENDLVNEQIELLKLRNTHKAFGFDSKLTLTQSENHLLEMKWENKGESIKLLANLKDYSYTIEK
ncbi:glycosidase [Acidaminobacter sp. JC074]|uniref:alpha-amylase family glycosyl hydrolase n=1 Tax=Acidaminobacter sp. JC074 TaxID=2530199 RepID=UPI001F0F790D|nr:glycosidase [Acidaminobacter sp. JC074]MCH4890843.1 glycosidase [Acidaminobacter sp. JC074]